MKCPDCNSRARKTSGSYTCERCGLTLEPWEIEKARKRAKDELKELEDEDPEKAEEKRKNKRIKYRNWYEGRET